MRIPITVLDSNQQPTGPFTVGDVRNKLYSGEFKASQLAHVEGLAAWTALSEVLAYIAKKEQEEHLNATLAPASSSVLQPAPGTMAPVAAKPAAGLSATQLATASLSVSPVPVRSLPVVDAFGLPPSAVLSPYPADSAFIYAPFWQRVVAHIIDSICVWVVLAIIGFAFYYFDWDTNVPLTLISIVIYWLYYSLQESGVEQGTIGKQVFGIRVTDQRGNRISFLQATARTFARAISILACCMGYIMPAFTEQSKGLHDFIASTLVIVGPKQTGMARPKV